MKTLEQRLEMLEKSNRRWRWCVGLLAVTIAGIAAARPGSGVAELIQARCVEIVDSEDKVVARLEDNQGGSLQLFNTDGKEIVDLEAGGAGGLLNLSSVDENNLLIASAFKKSGVILTKDVDEGTQTMLQGVGVRVYNPRGKIVAEMQSSKSNCGLIMANDFDGKTKKALSGG